MTRHKSAGDDDLGPLERQLAGRLGAAFESLLDLVTIESAIRDQDGRIIDFRIEYMNDVAIDVAGRRREELVGSTVLEMYPAMAGSDLFAGYVRTVETGEPTVVDSLPYEDVVDGRAVSGYYTVRVTRFEDGILIATRDISERERARLELESSRVELEAAQRLAHIGSWRWDLRTNETQWSTEMSRILGWDPEDPPPDRDVALAQLVAPGDQARVDGLTAQALATDGSFGFETQIVRTDGSRRDVIGDAEVVRDADGQPILMWGTCQDVTEQREAEQALERQSAELSRERAAAELLQRALLPAALPRVPGLELDGHYLPAGESGLVGGDWFDAFVLPDGQVGLVVGDVAGHGFAAAGLMGQLRNALRAHAYAGASPSEVFGLLDRLLVAIEPEAMATCVYATYDLATGTLRSSRAGHPPPVLVSGGEAGLLWGTSSPPLGTRATRDFTEELTTVPVGGVVFLYSDGLIERRGEVIDVGLDRLAAALAAWSAPTIAGLGKSLAGDLLEGPAGDDVCTLALRRTR